MLNWRKCSSILWKKVQFRINSCYKSNNCILKKNIIRLVMIWILRGRYVIWLMGRMIWWICWFLSCMNWIRRTRLCWSIMICLRCRGIIVWKPFLRIRTRKWKLRMSRKRKSSRRRKNFLILHEKDVGNFALTLCYVIIFYVVLLLIIIIFSFTICFLNDIYYSLLWIFINLLILYRRYLL